MTFYQSNSATINQINQTSKPSLCPIPLLSTTEDIWRGHVTDIVSLQWSPDHRPCIPRGAKHYFVGTEIHHARHLVAGESNTTDGSEITRRFFEPASLLALCATNNNKVNNNNTITSSWLCPVWHQFSTKVTQPSWSVPCIHWHNFVISAILHVLFSPENNKISIKW